MVVAVNARTLAVAKAVSPDKVCREGFSQLSSLWLRLEGIGNKPLLETGATQMERVIVEMKSKL